MYKKFSGAVESLLPAHVDTDILNDLRDLLNGAIVDNPPSTLSDGGVFKKPKKDDIKVTIFSW
mgnify:CR=1 FL=1